MIFVRNIFKSFFILEIQEERNRVFPTKSNAMVVDKSRDFDGKANKIFTEHSFAA